MRKLEEDARPDRDCAFGTERIVRADGRYLVLYLWPKGDATVEPELEATEPRPGRVRADRDRPAEGAR